MAVINVVVLVMMEKTEGQEAQSCTQLQLGVATATGIAASFPPRALPGFMLPHQQRPQALVVL